MTRSAGLWIAYRDVDLRPTLRTVFGEEIAIGDGVRAFGSGTDAQDLSTEILGVGGRLLCVVRFAVRSFIDGCVTVGIAAGMCVVTGGDGDATVGSEFDGAGMMTAIASLLGKLEEDAFGVGLS